MITKVEVVEVSAKQYKGKDSKFKGKFRLYGKFKPLDAKGNVVSKNGKVVIHKTAYKFYKKNEATKHIAKFTKKIVDAYMFESNQNIYDEFYEKYIQSNDDYWCVSTKNERISIGKLYLKDFYRDTTLKNLELKLGKFRNYLDNCKGSNGEKISYNRKRAVWNVNKQFLNYLIKEVDADIDIDKKLGKNKFTKGVRRNVTLNDEEFKNFIEIGERIGANEDLLDFIKFLYHTGLRKGEALALKISSFDMGTKTMDIKESFNSKKGIGNTKTQSSNRKIPLSPVAMKIIENVIDRRKIQNPSGWKNKPLFTFDNDKAFPDTTLTRRYNEISKAYLKEYNKDIHMHDLRHSYATNMSKKITNQVVLQKLMGHAKLSTTLEIYSSVNMSDMVEAVNSVTK